MGPSRTSLGACNGSSQAQDRRLEDKARHREKENSGGEYVVGPMAVANASEEAILESFGIGAQPGKITERRGEHGAGSHPAPHRLAPLPDIVQSSSSGTNGAAELREEAPSGEDATRSVLEYEASGMEGEGDFPTGPRVVDPQDMWQPAVAQTQPVNPSPIQLALAQAGNKTQLAKHTNPLKPKIK